MASEDAAKLEEKKMEMISEILRIAIYFWLKHKFDFVCMKGGLSYAMLSKQYYLGDSVCQDLFKFSCLERVVLVIINEVI